MKLTVKEVLRELRAQVRIYKAQIEKPVAPLDAITRAHIQHAIDALTIAIRYIYQGEKEQGIHSQDYDFTLRRERSKPNGR